MLSHGYYILCFLFTEFGVALTELTLEQDGVLQIRQMAALLLKQYVDTHWTSLSEKFKGPETTPAAKATIRNMLPHGLKESISKVSSFMQYLNPGLIHLVTLSRVKHMVLVCMLKSGHTVRCCFKSYFGCLL